jgi:putative ABC transport system ATP-binding protein
MSVETYHQTLIMITHNLEIAQMADRVLRMEDGRLKA